MSAKKKQADESSGAAPAGRRFGRGSRWMLVAATIVAVAGGASYAMWQQVREHVIASPEYQVDQEQIVISPTPPWIHTDIKAEVIREASFDGPLSLLQSDLTVRMASAFSSHPWIAHVQRVSKRFPAGLKVELVYRKPVAMVEVQSGAGALPVDTEGVVLPTQDFSPAEAESFPRIGEIHTTPAGHVGEPWGDSAVAGAAQVAAALAEDWKALDLYRIVPGERRPARAGAVYTFVLLTHSGTQVYWGLPPGADVPGELPAGEKLSQLKRYAAQNGGTLDSTDGPQTIEIRKDGGLVGRPRPTLQPIPNSDG